MRKSMADAKPFYMAWWPLWLSLLPEPEKVTLQRGLVGGLKGLPFDARAESDMDD